MTAPPSQPQAEPTNAQQRTLWVVREWLRTMVVDEQLCPFAKPALAAGSVRLVVTPATTVQALLQALDTELSLLCAEAAIETTLLVHPQVLSDFFEYNDFLNSADALLAERQLTGVFQVASFHPQYQFAGTQADDAENYSNRSPLPLLHILREDSVSRAVEQHPAIDQIPSRNVEHLNALGSQVLAARLAQLQAALEEIPNLP